MRPTLQDIASATNTSVSTVSRVLSGGTVAQRISLATRQKILQVAKKMGYQPNLIARSLRTRRTDTVGLLVSDIANPWFGQMASRIEQALHRHGYSLILCNSGEDEKVESQYLQLLAQRGIDGLIVVPLARTREALMEHLPENLPLVLLDRPIPGIAHSIASDQRQLAGQLCDTLWQVGVRQVALVCGPHHIVTHQTRASLVAERFKVIFRYEGPAQIETGRQAMVQLNCRPQAIICTNNFLGQGVIDAIDRFDKPPIIGCFDEIPLMHLMTVPVVCSNQDIPLMAEVCVDQLLMQLRGKQATSGVHTTVPIRVITNRAFREQFASTVEK
ncbi:MAG: LacI family DNA-binding transcriptional regulator [Phycisphaerales bacterium]|nr:LacI family DNA-binding transcriptional regulator [Phycisphaerales bacterium]